MAIICKNMLFFLLQLLDGFPFHSTSFLVADSPGSLIRFYLLICDHSPFSTPNPMCSLIPSLLNTSVQRNAWKASKAYWTAYPLFLTDIFNTVYPKVIHIKCIYVVCMYAHAPIWNTSYVGQLPSIRVPKVLWFYGITLLEIQSAVDIGKIRIECVCMTMQRGICVCDAVNRHIFVGILFSVVCANPLFW